MIPFVCLSVCLCVCVFLNFQSSFRSAQQVEWNCCSFTLDRYQLVSLNVMTVVWLGQTAGQMEEMGEELGLVCKIIIIKR